MDNVLDIRDLVLEFGEGASTVRALDGVTLKVNAGEIIGIVGESGSGKSTVGFVTGRLMPEGVRPLSGTVMVLGEDIWGLDFDAVRQIRKRDIRYVFQDPIATLDPTKRIGWQLRNAFEPHLSDVEIIQALTDVGLPELERVAAAWPHELSGGMAQRVVIALALIGQPKIIIADEATSSLDASVRTRILDTLRNRSRERGITLLLLSHDLWAMRMFCDRIAVMYGGRIVEFGTARNVFEHPAHPYTQALLGATAGNEKPGETLTTIPGIPPTLHGPSPGCAFAERCQYTITGPCHNERPQISQKVEGWDLLCHRWKEIEMSGNSAISEAS